MTTTCSAPGKTYLFGEHGLRRAIASAINPRTTATVAEVNRTTSGEKQWKL